MREILILEVMWLKKYQFTYDVNLSFSETVREHSFILKFLPREDENQHIFSMDYNINGNETFEVWKDSFGNNSISGCIRKPHSSFHYGVCGVAFVENKKQKGFCHPVFKYASDMTGWGKELEQFYLNYQKEIHGNFEKTQYWMELLSQNFQYEPFVTDTHTTGEEALKKGRGVCQDYAHILLALLRKEGIPSRYVAGFIEGEGQPHAWSEVYEDGYWLGFDPTHNRTVRDDYIRINYGRDSKDCTINCGRFQGNAFQSQSCMVKMQEIG